MLSHITILLVYQLAGEVIARTFDLAMPGPVIGMALLFATLLAKGGPSEGLNKTALGLLEHLSLLFVPAGVGVMMHLHLIGEEWVALSAALIGSTILTIAVTALVMRGCARLSGRGDDDNEIVGGP